MQNHGGANPGPGSKPTTSSWRTILLWVLWVLVIVYPFFQMNMSVKLLEEREIMQRDHHPKWMSNNAALNTPIWNNSTTKSKQPHSKAPTLYIATSNTPNFTYEIFDATSNVEKYGSPVVPAKERQWLEAKRKQWPPQHIPTLPLPIFVLNLPKSGTQSIFDYFATCQAPGKHWMAHYWIQRFHSKVGRCLADNVWHDRPMAQGCGEAKLAGYAIYTDSGLMWSEEVEQDVHDDNSTQRHKRSSTRKCFFPGVHGLENIAKYYPTATILHFPRNATQWVESSSHWNHLLSRYDTFCGGFPEILHKDVELSTMGEYTPKHPATSEAEWATWYEAYTQRIRDFARDHPSLTYVESPLEDINGTAKLLEELTGVSDSCYGRSHVNKKRRKKQVQH
jgi:hypothetical protein